MENEENDIIRQLAKKLNAHQEPYKEGAWEEFVRYEARIKAMESSLQSDGPLPEGESEKSVQRLSIAKDTKRRSLLRPWMAVAAAILLVAGAGWLYLSTNQLTDLHHPAGSAKQGAQVADLPSGVRPGTSGAVNAAESGSNVAGQINPQASRGKANAKIAANLSRTLLPMHPYQVGQKGVIVLDNHFTKNDQRAAGQIAAGALATMNGAGNMPSPGLKINPVGPVFNLPTTVQDGSSAKGGDLTARSANAPTSWDNNGKKTTGDTKNQAGEIKLPGGRPLQPSGKAFDDNGYFAVNSNEGGGRKWHMGVMVVPAMSNSAKLNMGYGVSVGYRLNNKLSLATGLAYSELTGSRNIGLEQGQGLAGFASSSRTLTALDASLTGLNMPLEIRYQVSHKIYIGTGVSAMAVLSDKVERRYAIAQMQSSALDANTGHALKPDAMQSIASNLNTREVIPEQEVGAKDFAGFINFSLGFKQPLNKSKSLAVEPFVSVPMSNNLFNQNIKMTNGGIRIKLGL